MIHSFPRKTAPRVVGGRTLRKNNHEVTQPFDRPMVSRQRPGEGYRHVLSQRDVHAFIEIVSEWTELSRGLAGIVLAAGDPYLDGRWHERIIYLSAWEIDLERQVSRRYFDEHAAVLDRLGVPVSSQESEWVTCHFDERSARGFQLLHVFLHELGHHHDAMTTRSRRGSRGEAFAEAFAREREAVTWERYLRVMR